MVKESKLIHPYIPNSVPEVKEKMLKEIGVKDTCLAGVINK